MIQRKRVVKWSDTDRSDIDGRRYTQFGPNRRGGVVQEPVEWIEEEIPTEHFAEAVDIDRQKADFRIVDVSVPSAVPIASDISPESNAIARLMDVAGRTLGFETISAAVDYNCLVTES